MKTLYESIKSNVGIGKYAKGTTGIDDGVPYTVVSNDGEYAYLISGLYSGRKGNEIVFKQDKDVNFSNSGFYNFTDNVLTPSGYLRGLSKDWKCPIYEEIVDIVDELKAYQENINKMGAVGTSSIFVLYKNKKAIYNLLNKNVYRTLNSTAHVRMLKKIKL